MRRLFRIGLTLGLSFVVLGLAADASAQSTADAKRTLKAQKLFYKEPGLIEVDVRAMRSTLMLTGSVPTEEHKATANELAKKVRGIQDIRDRLRVVEPDVAAQNATDEILMAKIQTKLDDDEDLAKAQAKEKFTLELTDGNVVIEGKLGDWSEAGSLVNSVRTIPGVKTIDFQKLKY